MTAVSPGLIFSTHSLVIGIAQRPELLSLLLVYILYGQSYAHLQIALLLSYKENPPNSFPIQTHLYCPSSLMPPGTLNQLNMKTSTLVLIDRTTILFVHL